MDRFNFSNFSFFKAPQTSFKQDFLHYGFAILTAGGFAKILHDYKVKNYKDGKYIGDTKKNEGPQKLSEMDRLRMIFQFGFWEREPGKAIPKFRNPFTQKVTKPEDEPKIISEQDYQKQQLQQNQSINQIPQQQIQQPQQPQQQPQIQSPQTPQNQQQNQPNNTLQQSK